MDSASAVLSCVMVPDLLESRQARQERKNEEFDLVGKNWSFFVESWRFLVAMEVLHRGLRKKGKK